MNLTVGALVDWILKNRKNGAFKGYSWEKITQEVLQCIENNTLHYSVNTNDEFNGVMCGELDTEKKTYFVYDALTTEKGVVKEFLKTFIALYPGYSLTGNVRNRKRRFNNAIKLQKRLN